MSWNDTSSELRATGRTTNLVKYAGAMTKGSENVWVAIVVVDIRARHNVIQLFTHHNPEFVVTRPFTGPAVATHGRRRVSFHTLGRFDYVTCTDLSIQYTMTDADYPEWSTIRHLADRVVVPIKVAQLFDHSALEQVLARPLEMLHRFDPKREEMDKIRVDREDHQIRLAKERGHGDPDRAKFVAAAGLGVEKLGSAFEKLANADHQTGSPAKP